MAYSYLISDELAELYLNYKNGKKVDQNLLELFFSFYEAVPFITFDQWKKYKSDDASILQSMIASGYNTKSEEQILDETIYRIKLTTDKNIYPCVNIKQGSIKKQIVASYKVGESRNEAICHLKNLCKDAKNIIMCDNYMFNVLRIENAAISIFFDKILSDNRINVAYKTTTKEDIQPTISYLKKLRPNCKITPCTTKEYNSVHDRYLLIDNKLEVVLSSGIDYLFDTSKEISIIYRTI